MSGVFTLFVMKESRWRNVDPLDSNVYPSRMEVVCRKCNSFLECIFGSSGTQTYEALDSSEHSINSLDDEYHDIELMDECIDSEDIAFNDKESNMLSALSKEYDKAIYGDIELADSSTKETNITTASPETKEILTDDGLFTRDVMLAVSTYGLCAMGYIVIDETIPLMLKLDRREGGLSYNSSEIGSLLAIGGMTMLIWTLVFLPKISHFSKLWLFKTFNVLCFPVTLLYPILATCSSYIFSYFGDSTGGAIVFILYAVIMTMKNCLATIIFLSVRLYFIN